MLCRHLNYDQARLLANQKSLIPPFNTPNSKYILHCEPNYDFYIYSIAFTDFGVYRIINFSK